MLNNLLLAQAAEEAVSSDPNFENVTLLLSGDGTNGGQNNTFIDGSTNNFTITRNGNVTQGTFSPYGDRWSNFFDGTGDYLTTSSNGWTQLSTGNFTLEAWCYITSYGSYFPVFEARSSAQLVPWLFGVDGSGFADFFYGTTTSHRLTDTVAVGLNRWVHIAAVRNGSTITLYVDGVSKGSKTYSTAINGGNSTPSVGRLLDPLYANGYISNARVVIGTAVYTANFTPSTAPLTAISGTSLLTCQSNRFRDASSNNFTITRNGDVSVQRFSPFSPSDAYSASVIGGSACCDGTGDYLTLADNNAFNLGASNFTAECWVYLNSTVDQYFFGQIQSTTSNRSFQIALVGGKFYFEVRSGSTEYVISAAASAAIKQWTHLAAVRNGNTITLYQNGISIGTVSVTGVTVNNSTNLLGVGSGGGYVAEPLNGYITDARLVVGSAVYTTSFSPPTAPLSAITNTALLCNFQNASIIDNAMMADLETVGNAQISTSVKKYGTGSLAFDGTGDWLLAPTDLNVGSLGSGDFTIEAWVYLANVTGSKGIVDFRTSEADATGFYFGMDGASIQVYVQSGINLKGGTLSATTWTHVAAVRSGSTITLYVSGSSVASTSNSTNWTSKSITVGGASRGLVNSPFNGYIDDLRITKGVARYTANFTPPAQSLPTK